MFHIAAFLLYVRAFRSHFAGTGVYDQNILVTWICFRFLHAHTQFYNHLRLLFKKIYSVILETFKLLQNPVK